MELKKLDFALSVCKLDSPADLDPDTPFYFFSKTDRELSLVCPTDRVPAKTAAREDGWRAFRIEGTLDFSLVGILSGISGILAENGIGLFAVSTYDTDYILVKEENFDRAIRLLAEAGHRPL
ncbi:MAG: ACT domain-containing protein [Clostridia bacterium]|nr:ACT domain-containing protein [Clostridia bacterium]